MKLDALVGAARITPVVRKQLDEIFVTDETIGTEMSRGSDLELFNKVVKALMDNDPVKLNEQSGPQTKVALSRESGDGSSNVLVKDAEKRAKEAETWQDRARSGGR